mgnify:CR=1 FL=1
MCHSLNPPSSWSNCYYVCGLMMREALEREISGIVLDKVECELEGESSGLKSYNGDTLQHIEDVKSQSYSWMDWWGEYLQWSGWMVW